MGSVTEIVDSGHNVVNKYGYKAYGGFKVKSETVNNRFSFTGREFDSETGLHYLRSRMYDSEVGGFTRKDDFWGFGFIPKTMNRYNYCSGNPVNWVDLLGLSSATPPKPVPPENKPKPKPPFLYYKKFYDKNPIGITTNVNVNPKTNSSTYIGTIVETTVNWQIIYHPYTNISTSITLETNISIITNYNEIES